MREREQKKTICLSCTARGWKEKAADDVDPPLSRRLVYGAAVVLKWGCFLYGAGTDPGRSLVR